MPDHPSPIVRDAAGGTPPMAHAVPHRRRFLQLSLMAGASVVSRPLAASACRDDEFATGRLVRTLRLTGRGGSGAPLDTMIGAGLDARRFTDLSALERDALITPTGKFFVRTGYPDGLDPKAPWKVAIGGLVQRPAERTIDELIAMSRPMGTHLLECAGNSDPSNFGLIGVAEWGGVPLGELVEASKPAAGATRVLVTGVDTHAAASRRSVAGASWILGLEDVRSTRSFLATHMNGAALPAVHGAPLRLVVPGWYACASVKWTSGISCVDDSVETTPHMREFAARTHQQGIPRFARDFAPPAIELAAMPIRVEQWIVEGRLVCKVVGIVWGGSERDRRLSIRIGASGEWGPVDVCPASPSAPWGLWSVAWRPPEAGRYTIVLKPADRATPAKRLGLYFYARDVWIDRV